MNSKKTRTDIVLNMLQQLVTLIIPLITTPYLSRVLGATGIGTYSYTDSIMQYFVLFGVLGLTVYGMRQIAYVRDDKEALSDTFWSILFLRCITTAIALIVYLLFVFNVTDKYRIVFLMQGIIILSNMVDISWLYIGIEDFRKTVFRSILIKIVGLFLIFVFVKFSSDLYIYVAIITDMAFLGNLSLWSFLPKTVNWKKPSKKMIFHHLKPTLVLFLPEIAIQMYAYFDKTMIGLLMGSVEEVAYYSKAQEIAKIPLALIGAVSTVMLPYMSNLHSNNKNDEFKNTFNQNIQLILFVSIGASFGIAGIASNMIPWLLGSEFFSVTKLLIIMSTLTVIISISNLIGKQYLVPVNKLKVYTVSVIVGAITNFFLNIILISTIGVVGACISTIIAEILVSFIQVLAARKLILWRTIIGKIVKYILAAMIMTVVVWTIGRYLSASIWTTLIQVICGSLVYLIVLLILKDSMAIIGLNIIVKKLHH